MLAGDLNIWRGYGGSEWDPRYRTVFDRLRSYKLALAGPRRIGGEPLPDCPCGQGEDCDHVRTYRHQQRKDSPPYQNDHVSTRGVRVEGCVAMDEERYWEHSDHCPLLVEVALG